MQHTQDVKDWTSLNGGFIVCGVAENSSCISIVLRSVRLSGSSSLISTKAPDVILATNFPGIGGSAGEITTGWVTCGAAGGADACGAVIETSGYVGRVRSGGALEEGISGTPARADGAGRHPSCAPAEGREGGDEEGVLK